MKTQKIKITGIPTERQKEFFASRTRFTAYGGARGGGKSWALRRKLVAMCLRYEGLTCLLIRRTLPELKSNHIIPLLREYGGILSYSESEKAILFKNGSKIFLGYCAVDKDALRYQGQEYDIIAIDEATQLSEFRFSVLKASLRGANSFPKRMYLTCNPGGIGHSWVKRIFIDRSFKEGENPADYSFIGAKVYDNPTLLLSDPGYITSLQSLPSRLRDAWLYGKWDVFEGQFFPEFDEAVHVCRQQQIPRDLKKFIAIDYGLDMLAVLLVGMDEEENLWILDEFCKSGLTLSEASDAAAMIASGKCEFAVCSPDLWNRRQDSGKSGFEIMQRNPGMPPMTAADDRRVAGWRVLREYLSQKEGHPSLKICDRCKTLISSLPALLCDPNKAEDASSNPHSITHAPEALRYAVMSRIFQSSEKEEESFASFFGNTNKKSSLSFYERF